MSGNSWVTLATNDSYSLGALVLGCSLKRTGTVHNLTVLVTPGVSASMRNQLAAVFNVVQEVNILDSKDEKNLALLTRPELGITFTKIHCWRLTQFSKCVFLDADVLVLRNCDELFEREELSAAPDVGWPDCFNSGVFVYRPSIETYNAIINLALSQGSFDGGDQGLLNQYFSDWATKDISRHLPFIYNMCSSATYSYLPAFKQFGQDVKIVHFIGSSKPWLQYLDSETRQVRPTLGSEHLQGLLQLWWDIFCNDIHSKLSPDMAGLAGALSQLTLGIARSPEQIALEEHLRKQAWEHGNVDYMGRDSFDNIWQKICQTLAEPLPDTFPEICALPSQVSSVAIDTFPQEVTSNDGVSLAPSQLPESVASENKDVGNITLPCSSSDVKLGIASDTALGDVCSFELKDVPAKSEGVPNIVNTVSKISGNLESSDVTVLGAVSLSDNASDNVISTDSVPTVINIPSDTNKVSDIVVPDVDETKCREISIPAPSPPISQINIVSEPLVCDLSDVHENEIHSVVHSEVPITLSDSKMSDCEERTKSSSQNIDSLFSKPGAEIVDEDSGSAPKLDGTPVSEDDATKSASPTSVPVGTNTNESVSSLDSYVISGLHSSSDSTNQTQTSPFVSQTDEPSSSIFIEKSSIISDPITVTESSDMQQKINVLDVPNYPLTSEVTDNTLTMCGFRTELVTPSSQLDSSVNIPEFSDQNCSPKIVDKIPITSGTLPEPETHVPASSDLLSSLEMKDKSPVTSDSKHKDETSSTQQEIVSNVSELTSTATKLPLDLKDASEKLTLSKVPGALEVCEGQNQNRSVETVETLQSVNVIEPTPPTSPLGSVLQTAVSSGSNILSIDSSIPETPPVGSKSAPIPQGQSNVTSTSILTSTSTSPSISTSTTLSIPTTTSPSSLTSTSPPVLTSITPSIPTTISPSSPTSASPPVLTSTTPSTPITTSSSSPTSTSPPVLTSTTPSTPITSSPSSPTTISPPVLTSTSPPVLTSTTPSTPTNTSPSIPASSVPESSVSSESPQTVEPQAPVPPKRRHRPSQKTQKGKK